jgi:hypothetical protein
MLHLHHPFLRSNVIKGGGILRKKATTSERTGTPELSEHISDNNTSIRCMAED